MTTPGGRRLLVPLTYGLSVRYAVPTGLLDQLGRNHEVVVGLGWDDTVLAGELGALGHEVVTLPSPRLDHDYRMFRRKLLELRDLRLDSPTTPMRIARQRAELPDRPTLALDSARRAVNRLQLRWPGAIEALERAEPEQIDRGTNVDEFETFLDDHHIDAVLSFTPYHDQDALLMWSARRSGRATVTSVISFDNPTTRERLVVRSPTVAVWNRHNREQLARTYPDLDAGSIAITGAPQFDLHRRTELVVDREEWARRVGVPRDRPVILYGAGPSVMLPNEERLVALIDDAIESGAIPGRPYLLVRRHPVDPAGSWMGVASDLRNGTVVDPWAEGPDSFRSWPSAADMELQMSTLCHAEVHVNVCSSMSLDGAMFDRPQIGPSFLPGATPAELGRFRGFYRQEHWLPIGRSGGVAQVDTPAQLVSELASALREPEARAEGRRRMIAEVLTHDDGASTARLVEVVGTALGGPGIS